MSTPTNEHPITGRTILLAGGTSRAGVTVARTAAEAGARVVVVGRRSEPPEGLPDACEFVSGDVTDQFTVASIARRIGRIDGLFSLVGGWRGGGGLEGQTEGDYRTLETMFTALRVVTRQFSSDLASSPHGRVAIISATALEKPTAGSANYIALKSASEGWMRSVAEGFAGSAKHAGAPQGAAAVIFRVKALDGLEQAVADAFVDLWNGDAAELNGTTRTITG